jgi:hypothetical protein
VNVSAQKEFSQTMALILCLGGTALVAFGVACAIINPAPPAIWFCLASAALGMIALISGYLLGYAAMDPPIPEFDYETPSTTSHRAWELPPAGGDPRIAALNSLTQLLGRIDAGSRSATRARDRALAAHIDGNQDALHRLRRECRAALGLLRRAIDTLPAVLAEVQPILDERLADERAVSGLPRAGESLVTAARDMAKRLHLTEDDLAIVAGILSESKESDIAAGRETMSAGGLLRLGGAFEQWLHAVEKEYSGYEFLSGVDG